MQIIATRKTCVNGPCRQHLTSTPGRVAMAAARALEFHEKQAKERMKAGGESAGRSRPKHGVPQLWHPYRSRSCHGHSWESGRHLLEAHRPRDGTTHVTSAACTRAPAAGRGPGSAARVTRRPPP